MLGEEDPRERERERESKSSCVYRCLGVTEGEEPPGSVLNCSLVRL